jgi:hypothetical protein
MAARVIREGDGYWSVEYNGHVVLSGESFAVADQLVMELNGVPGAVGEVVEVADAIRRREVR